MQFLNNKSDRTSLQKSSQKMWQAPVRKRQKRAFTLIELLVSIGLFMMFLGIVSQSYISIVRTQRQANEVRRMYSDVRTVLDTLAQEIRLGSIDYDCYYFDAASFDPLYCPDLDIPGSLTPGQTQSSHLALVAQNGRSKTLFKVEDGQLFMQRHTRQQNGGWGPAPGYENYQPLTSDRITFDYLSFAVFPDVNPYSDDPEIYADNGTQFQPKVTIFMSVRNSDQVTTPFSFDFQTTVSSRVYSRAS